MSLNLHAFKYEDKEGIVLHGWEFPDVIASGSTLQEAKKNFLKLVKVSLNVSLKVSIKPDITQINESLGKVITKNVKFQNTKLLNEFIKCQEVINEYQHGKSNILKSSDEFRMILQKYLHEISTTPISQNTHANNEKKVEILVNG